MNETTMTIHSLVTPGGELRLTLEDDPLGAVASEDVVVQMEGAPINPSDLVALLGPADPSTLGSDTSAGRPVATATVPPDLLQFAAARAGKSLTPGVEGAGIVVKAGEEAQHLLGKVVGAWGGGMYTRYRRLPARDVVPFPDGVSAKQAAAAFVNPLTALSMLSTMRLEGHTALVHTAAASNLGQMLNKLCIEDGVELVTRRRTKASGRRTAPSDGRTGHSHESSLGLLGLTLTTELAGLSTPPLLPRQCARVDSNHHGP